MEFVFQFSKYTVGSKKWLHLAHELLTWDSWPTTNTGRATSLSIPSEVPITSQSFVFQKQDLSREE